MSIKQFLLSLLFLIPQIALATTNVNSVATMTAYSTPYAGQQFFVTTATPGVSQNWTYTGPTNGFQNTTSSTNAQQTGKTWIKYGPILTPIPTSDQGTVQEPALLPVPVEGNPQILTSLPLVWKMWFREGWSVENIYYAEAPPSGPNGSPGPWTRWPTASVTGHAQPDVFEIPGSNPVTYVMLASPYGEQIDKYISTDGHSFTLANSAVVTLGGQSWYSNGVYNNSVTVIGSTVNLMLEGINASGVYSIGLFTAPVTNMSYFTPYSGNPVISNGIYTRGSPSNIFNEDGEFYIWCHGTNQSGTLPTDMYRYESSAIAQVWTASPNETVFPRTTLDEGVNSLQGQVADPFLTEWMGWSYDFYSASPNGSVSTGGGDIKMAIYPGTLSQLVATTENAPDNNTLSAVSTGGTGPTYGVPNAGIALDASGFLQLGGVLNSYFGINVYLGNVLAFQGTTMQVYSNNYLFMQGDSGGNIYMTPHGHLYLYSGSSTEAVDISTTQVNSFLQVNAPSYSVAATPGASFGVTQLNALATPVATHTWYNGIGTN